jgi:hypothetical protein
MRMLEVSAVMIRRIIERATIAIFPRARKQDREVDAVSEFCCVKLRISPAANPGYTLVELPADVPKVRGLKAA